MGYVPAPPPRRVAAPIDFTNRKAPLGIWRDDDMSDKPTEQSYFAIHEGDCDLGGGVFLRWTADANKVRTGALVFHPNAGGEGNADDFPVCVGSISFKNDPDGHTRPTWDFNGDFDRPTMTPSIRCSCGHHGFVTEGKWVDA